MASKKKKGGKSMPAYKIQKNFLEQAQEDVDDLKESYKQQQEEIEPAELKEFMEKNQKNVLRKSKLAGHLKKLNPLKELIILDKSHLFDPLGYREFFPLHKIQDIVSQLKKNTDIHLVFSGVQQLTDAVFAILLDLKDDRYLSVTQVSLAGCHHVTDRGVLWLTMCFQNLNLLNLMGCVKVTEDSLVAVTTNCKNMASLNITGTSISILPVGLSSYTDVSASYLPLASPPLEVYKAEKLNILKDSKFFNKADSCVYKVLIIRRDAVNVSLLKLIKKEKDMSIREQVTCDLSFKVNQQHSLAFIECPESVMHLFSSKRTCYILPYRLDDNSKLKQEAATIAGFICKLTAQVWPSHNTYTLVGINNSTVSAVPPDVLKEEVVSVLTQIQNNLSKKLIDMTDPKNITGDIAHYNAMDISYKRF